MSEKTETRRRVNPGAFIAAAVVNLLFGGFLDFPGIRNLDDVFEALKRTRNVRWAAVVWLNGALGFFVFDQSAIGPGFVILLSVTLTLTIVNRLSVGSAQASAGMLPWLFNRSNADLTFFGVSSFWKLTIATATAALAASAFALLAPGAEGALNTIAMITAGVSVVLAVWDSVRSVLDFRAVTAPEEQDEVFLEDQAGALGISEASLTKGTEAGTLKYRTDGAGVRTLIVPLIGRRALAQGEVAFRDAIAHHSPEWELVPDSVTESTYQVRLVTEQELQRRGASKASGGLFDAPLAPVGIPSSDGAPGINLSQL